MKRIALAVVTTLGLILAPLVVVQASASAAVPTTIAGPDQVGYYANVPITGTAAPGAKVAVYFRATGGKSFVERRAVAADSAGRWSTSYYAASDDEYYAVAGGVASPVHRTALVTATCTTSGPAFRTMPGTAFAATQPHFAGFSATRNGEWAGVAYSPSRETFSVLSWRAGRPVVTLATFVYTVGLPREVQVVGVTPGGGVVASVQAGRAGEPYDPIGVVLSVGHRVTLSHSAGWTMFAPVGVSDHGAIAGWAQTGSGSSARYYAVRWASPTAHYTILGTSGTGNPSVVIDGYGDVGYVDSHQVLTAVLATGQVRTLSSPQELGGEPLTASGRYVYAQSFVGTLRWDMATPGTGSVPAQIVTEAGDYTWVGVAGPRGDFVDGLFTIRHLRTADGAFVALPKEYQSGDATSPAGAGEAIDSSGRVAFTSAADGLPHFLTCRTVTAQNDGRPVAGSTAADVDGDGRADLLATKPDGSLWYYRNTGNAAHPFSTGRKIGTSGWNGFTKLAAADVNGDHRADLVAVRPDGTLWYYRNTGSATHPFTTAGEIGASGWNGFTKLAAADVNGDHRADLVAVRPDGTLWYYRNTGSATRPFSTASEIGASGWNAFDKLALADVDGDQHADVLATRPDGTLWYYRNTGSATRPFSTASEIGASGWNAFDKLVAGDTDGDGHADLLVTRPTGILSLYPNTQSSTRPFAGRTQIGLTGWQAFDRLL
ncbi:MAG: FG-GAP repeat domain-containing protein [Jatrophihabitantaceae bacterium]